MSAVIARHASRTVLDHVLSHRWQRPALWAGGFCWFMFALVAVVAVGREGNSVDHGMWESSPGVASWNLARLMLLFRQLGNPSVIAPIAVVLTLLAAWRPWTRLPGLLAAGTFLGGVLIGTVLKSVFRQSGPPVQHGGAFENGTAFPSGHTLVATLFFGCLAAFAACFLNRRWLPALAAGWEAVALGVGTCQVLLRTHWLSDVVAAWFFAMGWLLLSAVVIARLMGVRDPEPAHPAAPPAPAAPATGTTEPAANPTEFTVLPPAPLDPADPSPSSQPLHDSDPDTAPQPIITPQSIVTPQPAVTSQAPGDGQQAGTHHAVSTWHSRSPGQS